MVLLGAADEVIAFAETTLGKARIAEVLFRRVRLDILSGDFMKLHPFCSCRLASLVEVVEPLPQVDPVRLEPFTDNLVSAPLQLHLIERVGLVLLVIILRHIYCSFSVWLR